LDPPKIQQEFADTPEIQATPPEKLLFFRGPTKNTMDPPKIQQQKKTHQKYSDPFVIQGEMLIRAYKKTDSRIKPFRFLFAGAFTELKRMFKPRAPIAPGVSRIALAGSSVLGF
jgi:hypothetical protein